MNEIITLISHEGFGLNTNILETNVINIGLLIGLLIYSFSDVVKSTLKEREESISLNLDTAALPLTSCIAFTYGCSFAPLAW